MVRLFMLGLALLLAGCVTEVYDSEGRRMGPDALEKSLVMDDDGRIIARPTRLIAPHTIIINGGTPTEREIRLLGVEGQTRRQAPNTYARAQQWMRRFVAEEDEIFIRPAIGTNPENRVIYGDVYLYAREPGGDIVPGGYVSVNEAMLSQGLVKIRDIREFEVGHTRTRMQNAEDRARREREGLWSDNP